MRAFLTGQTQFDFFRLRVPAYIFSIILVVVSFVGFFTKGLNWGLDFTGGTYLEVQFQEPANLPVVRNELKGAGFNDAVVQLFGTARDVSIRVPTREGVSNQELGNQIMTALTASGQKVEMKRVDFVGSVIGKELAEQGGMALLFVAICMLIYVSIRFQWKLAVGAVLALLHDPIITIGVFAWLQIEVDLTTLAAVLAVLGYSMNDTIVVFDRMRENFRKVRSGTPKDIMNLSTNQTLSRTTMTSGLTLVTVLALFFFGGPMLHSFSTALLVGILVGTYSSIYVAAAVALAFKLSREDLLPAVVEKEGADQQSMLP